MNAKSLNKPGNLITYRSRDWMVLPSGDPELMMIKPLGGSEEETTAIYLPLQIPGEEIKEAHFSDPQPNQLGAFTTARLLYDASRLSFRNASGPFRCMGKLSFRPRSYQLVPLVMALKQKVTRLLVADDVGIGKTIEALIILKELMERGDVRRFAVICPPHLCEQWAQELKDKLDIDAEIVRSSTAARLDRQLPDDRSVFHHLPYQVVSIDYVKTDKRRGIFLNDCPEFVIVDEAHTCTLPENASSKNQQLRYSLLHDLALNTERHLLLLTATPHSGKDGEFLSLLGLLKKEFKELQLDRMEAAERRKLADYFIQRKRENIKRWLKETTSFPERENKEIGYQLSPEYQMFFQNVLRFARGISNQQSDNKQTQLLRSWAAIALIKGVMSSPAMAIHMLENRNMKLMAEELEESIPAPRDVLFDPMEYIEDSGRSELMDALPLEGKESEEIIALQNEARALANSKADQKVHSALKLIREWMKVDFNPIIFCKYISTARYVEAFLKAELPKNIHVEAVTSEMADEQRREKIDAIGQHEKRVLVATDCLSEGINLQGYFNAVLHYDLPWNPNRIEQREGRVDRFGQTAPIVKAYMLYGDNNLMDEFVMEVLIKKVRDIHKSTGVTISIGEDTENLMTQAARKLLFEQTDKDGEQLRLFAEETVRNELELARKKGENLRSIFAHESIKPEAIEADLKEVDEAIGDLESVAHFVINSLEFLKAECIEVNGGFRIVTSNLPPHLKAQLSDKNEVLISFESPTPRGFRYIGRNHLFVEQLCHFMLALAFDGHPNFPPVARMAEIQSNAVSVRTTLVMFRVRNVIKEIASTREVISEEMYLWGYSGLGSDMEVLSFDRCKQLMLKANSKVQLPSERQIADLDRELKLFHQLKDQFSAVASERAEKLVEAHGRFKDLVGGRRYEKATPVLPPDVMGVYILMPVPDAV